MTKKFLVILATLSIIALMCLNSCTAAGIECGLIGKWEYSVTINGDTYKTIYEFKSSDTLILSTYQQGALNTNIKFTVDSVNGHTIKYENNEMEYRNLTCDSVEFGFTNNWIRYYKVY